MKIKSISLTKSKTIGVVSHEGKTRFNKIILMAEADIDENDDKDKAYKELSNYIEDCMDHELTIKK